MAVDPNTKPLEEWVQEALKQQALNVANADEMDIRLLSRKPSQHTVWYLRMKAYKNHFRVVELTTDWLQTYDSGVASIFHVPTEDAWEVSINYVGILKDIFKVDYRPLHTLVILIRCDWMKRVDNRGNNTYTRDETGFLVVNFHHKLPWMADPFIFPSQATQVFFLMIRRNHGGRWFYGKRPVPNARW
jgi:hypothetical protein